jgi:hypothetical protein
VEELGSVAALIAISSGVSSLALALEISDRTAVSLSWTCAASRISDRDLIRADIIFLLSRQLCRKGVDKVADQSSASVMEKLLGKSINCPYRLKYLAHVAWKVPSISAIPNHAPALKAESLPSMRASASFGPSSTASLFFISLAALLVNVTAVISIGRYPCFRTKCATREVSTRVLPDPGPARIWSGTSGGEMTAIQSVQFVNWKQRRAHSPFS